MFLFHKNHFNLECKRGDWHFYSYKDYHIEALLDKPSIAGINNGKIVSLSIRNALGNTVAWFYHGWRVTPQSTDKKITTDFIKAFN